MATVYKSLSKSSSAPTSSHKSTNPKLRQKVLILSSRGVTYRHRHLLNDLYLLLPHSRKESKLDTKTKLYQLNELAELYSCNNVMFFEARKGKDLYIWISKAPNGPTVKMHLQNCMLDLYSSSLCSKTDIPPVHTTSELHFPGNCLRGSRPILSFSSNFSTEPHLQIVKELFTHIFGVPKTSRKIKPFVDHVMGFTFADGKIWIRCFEIKEEEISKTDREVQSQVNGTGHKVNGTSTKTTIRKKGSETKLSLVEIGPRFVLTPIVILESSFGGPVIYENKEFISPNQIRSNIRLSKAGRHNRRVEAGMDVKRKKGDLGLRTGVGRRQKDALDDKVLFA